MTGRPRDESLAVRQATASDLHVAVSILREAADWLKSRNMPLWPASDFTVEKLKPTADAGDLIVAENSREIIAVVQRQWEDALFWPDRTAGEAVYLHKLAIRRAKAGQGYVISLIDWIDKDAAARDLEYLRLDCAPRPALLNIYKKMGFVYIDERKVGEFTVARLQKKCTPC